MCALYGVIMYVHPNEKYQMCPQNKVSAMSPNSDVTEMANSVRNELFRY